MGDLNIQSIISRIIILIIAFTVHEFSHAKVADMFGDMTPRTAGRLTLNPLKHLDPLGSLLLLFRGFGWARPVPVDPYALGRASTSAMMLVALAGPFSNFIMALFAVIPLRLGWLAWVPAGNLLPSADNFLYEFIFTNLALTFFNLIPLPPLDGDKIAEHFFPPSWQRVQQSIRPYGSVILLTILFILPTLGFDLLGPILYPPITNITNLLIGY